MSKVETIHEMRGLHPDVALSDFLGKLKDVVIVGHDHDGEEVFACSMADGGEVLWLLERAKHKLMNIVEEEGL